DQRGCRRPGQNDGRVKLVVHERSSAFIIGEELRSSRIECAIGFQETLCEHGCVRTGRSEIDALASQVLDRLYPCIRSCRNLQHGWIEIGYSGHGQSFLEGLFSDTRLVQRRGG